MENGGFKMINTAYQENSLKLVWLQRLLAQEANITFWQEHIKSVLLVPIQDFIKCNIRPKSWTKRFIKTGCVLPIYWIDILDIWFKSRYASKAQLKNCPYVNSMPMVFNTAIPLFCQPTMSTLMLTYKTCKRLNIFTISEFVNCKLSVRVKMKIGWFQIYDAIPLAVLQKTLKETPSDTSRTQMEQGLWAPRDFQKWFREVNECRNDKAILKWSTDLETDIAALWTSLCNKGSELENVKLRTFHIEFLNRSYHLNKTRALYLNISPLCALCDSAVETYIHVFWDCPRVKNLWIAVMEIAEMIEDDTVIDRSSCILSNFNSSLMIFLSVYLKRWIFFARIYGWNVSLAKFFLDLKARRERHYTMCRYQNKIQKHMEMWSVLSDDRILNEYISQ